MTKDFFIPIAFIGVLVGGCDSEVEEKEPIVTEEPPNCDDPNRGTDCKNLANFWSSTDNPYGNNVKFLNFSQLRKEVERVTDNTAWIKNGVDQWARYQSALGGGSSFELQKSIRSMHQVKLTTVRRMGKEVCEAFIQKELVGPATLFTELAPDQVLSPEPISLNAQLKMFDERFFFEEPNDEQINRSKDMLSRLTTAGASPSVAWQMLCASNLASMEFLTY